MVVEEPSYGARIKGHVRQLIDGCSVNGEFVLKVLRGSWRGDPLATH
jgi:hypothetical protein